MKYNVFLDLTSTSLQAEILAQFFSSAFSAYGLCSSGTGDWSLRKVGAAIDKFANN
jgi:hypothetical protein